MLMDVMGIGLLSPVAPQIVLRFSSEAVMVTMVTVVYAAGQFFASPIIGKLGDRFGRRPVLLVSMAGQALSYLIFGLGGSMAVLLAGRLIGGITAGNFSTASAYVADISKPSERAKNFGLVSIAWSLGLILGPALGGLFGQISLEAPTFVAAALAGLNVLLGIFLLPESLPPEKRTNALHASDFNPIASILEMVRKPGLGILMLVYSLFSIAFNGANSTVALFIIQKFGAVTWQISLMLILGGAASTLNNLLVVPRVVPVVGEKNTGALSLLMLAAFYIAVFFAPVLWLVFPFSMLASSMNSFIFPAITTLTTERVTAREIGTLMGVTSAVGSLMNIIGPLYAGVAYDTVMRGAPHWMGAILLVFAAWLLARSSNPQA